MAIHYTCDRCGADCSKGIGQSHGVEIDWPDAEGEKETVALQFSVNRPRVDFETPDLCGDCYAHILNMVASMLDTDTEKAVQP